MLTINPVRSAVGLPPNCAPHSLKQKERLFELYYSNENFKRRTVIKSENSPLISGVYFNLGSQFDCVIPGLNKNITFHGNHFVLVHLPNGYHDYCVVNKGNHRSLIMNVSNELLKLWCSDFRGLFASFQHSYEAGTPYVFCNEPIFIRDKYVKTVNALIYSAFVEPGSDAKIYSMCQLLLLECLQHLELFGNCISRNGTRDKVFARDDFSTVTDEAFKILRRSQEFLTNNMSIKVTLDQLAHEVDARPAFITSLFQKHYGVTALEWLKDERLKHAQSLVFKTTADLRSIGRDIGYVQEKNFTKAFKKKFRYTPAEMRASCPGHL
jgi:AraC-like DNA-binding protein